MFKQLKKPELLSLLPEGQLFLATLIGTNRLRCKPGHESTLREVISNSQKVLSSRILEGPNQDQISDLTWKGTTAYIKGGSGVITIRNEQEDFLEIVIMSEGIESLAAEFARLDPDGCGEGAGYSVNYGSEDEWPSIGWYANHGNQGHKVLSVHPKHVVLAIAVLKKYNDDEEKITGRLPYSAEEAMAKAGVRCKWHI